ncbi:hypothetical protein GE061_013713 [Apolygus lucorum]|uniref:Uncharacterized protein n=1 Tax=Apolygus lucorum TaxID=248454 RepID=A0A6A4KEV9_APOLU|nr:hypothetical protein GE061_013713 [Apolygus lucorum]
MVRKVFDYIMDDPVFGEKENAGMLPLTVSVLCFSLMIGIIAKLIFDRYSITIFFVLSVMSGYGVGKICLYSFQDREILLGVSSIVPKWTFKILIPVFVYTTAYRLEHIKFLGMSQILFLSVAGTLFYATSFSLLMSVMYGVFQLCFDWQMRTLTILLFAIYIFQPELTIEKLESKGGHVKYLQALLKGEILWVYLVAFTVGDIIYESKEFLGSNTELFLIVLQQFSGLFVGFAYGILVQFFYKYAYNDPLVSPLISFPMSLLAYSSADLIHTSGSASVCAYAIYVTVVQKPKIAVEHDRFSKELWNLALFFGQTYIAAVYGFVLGAVERGMDFRMIAFGFAFLATSLMVRFLVCFVFLPYLYGRKTQWAEVALLVIGPYRGSCSFLLVLRFAREDSDESFMVLVVVYCVVMSSLFLNVVCLDWFLKRLNIFSLSKPQISNMTTAVEQINKCRGNMIFAEKLERIVADANWSIVTAVTSFSHPYKDRIKSSQFGEALKEDVKTVQCPRCGAWSIAPPTRKELDEITKETKLRVMKAQQVSYLKQRDAGTLTENGYKFLSSLVYQASYTTDISVNTDDLRINAEDLKFVKKCESFFNTIYNVTLETYEWQPTNRIRLKCYNIVTSQTFKIVMAVASVFDMFLCLAILYFYATLEGNIWPLWLWILGWIAAATSPFFWLCNIVESAIQILGLGVMQYFSRRVYIIEFFSCVVMRTVQGSLYAEQCSVNSKIMNLLDCTPVVVYMNLLMFLRVTRFYIFFVTVIPYILARIKRTIDEDLLRRYDIGKAYLVGLDRVLKYLNQLTTNEQVLEEIKKEVETNRQKVTKELSVIQKEHPTVAITVKTKHAIKHVINSINDCAIGMQTEGILDNIEYTAFERSIQTLRARLNLLKVIVPPSPINIMKEISWLVGDDENIDLFLKEAQMTNYDYNDVLIRNGDDPVGLYILMSGLLKAQYVPSSTSVQLAAKFGVLPNYDFFENFKFDQPQEDFIVSGNVVGEYGVVTGRRYDMTVVAETAVQVYYVPWDILKDLHQTFAGQLLLEKIWRKVAIKISVTLLQFTTNYRHWSAERLLIFLNKGVIPNLTGIVAVNVDQRVEELILVEGVAMDLNNQKIIYGPYRIPKTVTKLLLPEHQAWDFQTVYDTKLFVIPMQGCAITDLLEAREEPSLEAPPEEGLKGVTAPEKLARKKADKARKVGFTQDPDD